VRWRVACVVLGLAFCVTPTAAAKFRTSLAVSDRTPRVGQPITVLLHADRELSHDLKLVAVAPGAPGMTLSGASRASRASSTHAFPATVSAFP
jgi:hypothetical protein